MVARTGGDPRNKEREQRKREPSKQIALHTRWQIDTDKKSSVVEAAGHPDETGLLSSSFASDISAALEFLVVNIGIRGLRGYI